ncbi:MAG: hypothetical protein ACE15B_19995 [Bryobacteraceae bacterium]
MNREEARNLLGGYAAGNLTEAERRALFEAALEDQELFNELAREEPLRELLEDPAARATVLAELREIRLPWWRRPLFVAPALAAAAALVVAVIAVQPRREAKESLVAELRPPPPAAPVQGEVKETRSAPAPRRAAVREKAKEAISVPAPAPPAEPERKREAAAEAQLAEAPATVAADKAVAARAPAGAMPRMAFSAAAHRAPATPAVAVTVLRKGDDGVYDALSGRLHTGDSVRLNLVPASAGQLTVWQAEPSGGRVVLFDGPVEARKSYVVPAEGSVQSEQPGRCEILVRLGELPVVTVTLEFQ